MSGFSRTEIDFFRSQFQRFDSPRKNELNVDQTTNAVNASWRIAGLPRQPTVDEVRAVFDYIQNGNKVTVSQFVSVRKPSIERNAKNHHALPRPLSPLASSNAEAKRLFERTSGRRRQLEIDIETRQRYDDEKSRPIFRLDGRESGRSSKQHAIVGIQDQGARLGKKKNLYLTN